MISIQSAMLVALGFFAATFLGFLLAPLYRRRAERLASEKLKATIPLTSAEIAADKDRLRAQFALTTHKLEKKLEVATHASAKQMVEINRRDAWISSLEGDVQRLTGQLEEHENARRVLEQTITERLPKVEFRLTEAKKLLFQRDREITNLTQQASRQVQALEEATQINAQQRDEIHKLNATLAARAARNRDTVSDPRFDGEVALRAEIETLRAKTRDQSALISRLQGVLGNSGARPDQIAGMSAAQVSNEAAKARGADTDQEVQRLKTQLAEAEIALKAAQRMAAEGNHGQQSLESEIRALKIANEDQGAELARLRAALVAYQDEEEDDRSVRDSKIAMRAKLSSLQAQADEQSSTIQKLRAEVAAANEKLARQAAHFMDEMKRLGAGMRPASGAPSREPISIDRGPARPALVDRLQTPRPARAATVPQPEDQARVNGFIKALGGSGSQGNEAAEAAAPLPANGNGVGNGSKGASAPPAAEPAAAAAAAPRRGSLLERITRSEKPAQ